MADPTVAVHVGQLLQRVPGGIGRYVQRLLGALHELSVDLTTFAAGSRPARVPTDHFVDLGWPRGRLRYEWWHHWRRSTVDLRTDVVHAPSLAVPPVDSGRLVVTVHDLAFIRLPHYFTVHGIRFHERGLHLARREAEAVVVPSEFVAGELVAEGFDPDRVHVARHGIRPATDRPDEEVDATLARLEIERPYLLFVGTLEPRKGIATLINAQRRLRESHPDVTLVLAGPKGWGKLPDLDRPGVVLVGHVTDDELDALYRGAVALAYPSHYEGFGLPLLEAMVRGCPVVSSDATSLPEVAGDAALLVPAADADALAEGLARLVDDPEEREALARRGHERAATFTWEASGRAHLAVYRRVTDGSPA